MTKLTESEYNRNKQEVTMKNFRFNRYLMLRYTIALFFFVNLYWFIILWERGFTWIFPGALMLLAISATYEQLRLYGDKSKKINKKLDFNHYFYFVQTVVNICLIVIALTGLLYQNLFPFLTNAMKTRLVLSGGLILGVGLSLLCLKRIKNIKENKDKFYGQIKEFERQKRKI